MILVSQRESLWREKKRAQWRNREVFIFFWETLNYVIIYSREEKFKDIKIITTRRTWTLLWAKNLNFNDYEFLSIELRGRQKKGEASHDTRELDQPFELWWGVAGTLGEISNQDKRFPRPQNSQERETLEEKKNINSINGRKSSFPIPILSTLSLLLNWKCSVLTFCEQVSR